MVTCRSCGSSDLHPVLDLGAAPPSNAYLTAEEARGPELWLPLRVDVCTGCWLMQTEDFVTGSDVFTGDYGYFSSMSESWLRHAHDFVALMQQRLSLGPESLVIEVASNDGYLLQYVKAAGVPCVGIEPTHSTAAAAESLGITVEKVFLTAASALDIAERHGLADLVVANNVVAHVPDVIDFARGLAHLLKPDGTLVLEFAYAVDLIREGQFDTVYHEHFSYLTLTSLVRILSQAGLYAVDVTSLPTHGGSLRVFVKHRAEEGGPLSPAVDALMQHEVQLGVTGTGFYSHLQDTAVSARQGLLRFLLEAQRDGRSVAGYGAAAKGSTLLNFAGVRSDLLPFVVDKSPGKVGRFLPGSRIPVLPVEALFERQITDVLLLPWNLGSEVVQQLAGSAQSMPAVFTAVPTLRRIA